MSARSAVPSRIVATPLCSTVHGIRLGCVPELRAQHQAREREQRDSSEGTQHVSSSIFRHLRDACASCRVKHSRPVLIAMVKNERSGSVLISMNRDRYSCRSSPELNW